MRLTLLAAAFSLLPILSYTQSESGTWLSDSLEFYKQKVNSAANSGDTVSLIQLQSHVYVEGTKSLELPFYDFLYGLAEDQRITRFPYVLAKIRHNIGNLEFYRSRMDAAKSNFNLALESYQQAGQAGDAAGMAMNLGIIQERSGKYDSAILSYERAMPIFLSAGDSSAIAVCLENIGLAYRYKGEVKEALNYLQQTDSLLTLITPPNAIRWSYLYYNFSQVYVMLGDYGLALDYALKGLRISQEQESERQTNIGYIELQHIYQQMGDDENWLKYINKALTFAKESDNGMRVADLEYSLGSFYIDHDQLDSASYFIDSGLAYYENNDIVEGLGRGYMMKGHIYFEQGDYDAAIESYTTALSRFSPSSVEISRAYHSLGVSYMKKNEYALADEYLQKALELRLKSGELSFISDTYKALSENSRANNDHEAAYDHLLLYKTYQDSLFNENKAKQLAEIQIQYETEQKDQEILALEQDREIQALLAGRRQNQIYLVLGGLTIVFLLAAFYYNRSQIRQRANKLLQEKNEKIEKQHAEKEDLLKEIHHRVKNNLQIISSLLSMQSRTLHDDQAIDAMKESQSRVKTMALIHEKLYQYDSLSRINMREYLGQLSDFLAQTYRTEKDIHVEVDADDINLDIDTAVPLGLITNELLSNAWKYAFEEKSQGEIHIKFRRTDEGYRLEIQDTGRGIAKDIDLAKSKSLGLKLVRSLTRQIHGELEVLHQNPGTAFRVEFRELMVA